jgi:NAD(P)-dependent dehydrogenase (short-subunit alcohol dehydrogenase family)
MKKTILITGSSSGLGYQLAKELSRSYRIIGCGRKRLKCKFQNYYQIDLNNLKEVEEWIEEITKKNINLYGFVNNASLIPVQHPALLYDSDLINNVANVNISSQILMITNLTKIFLKNPNKIGRIINISSMSAALNESGTSIYAASKIFLEKFLSIFSKELSKTNITANTIGITYFDTPSFRGLNNFILKKSFEKTNIKRTLNIAEIMYAINFFLDQKANIINGQKLYLGMSI